MSYENYGNLNSKICQLLDIFCWVRKKETFSLAFLHSSLRVVCEESKQWAQNLFEIWYVLFTYVYRTCKYSLLIEMTHCKCLIWKTAKIQPNWRMFCFQSQCKKSPLSFRKTNNFYKSCFANFKFGGTYFIF